MIRGGFIGLTSRHSRAHLTRSVLEGVGYGLRDNLELLKGMGLASPERIVISGGGAKSRLWNQILADILGFPLSVAEVVEGAAVGAALLAGTGIGLWDSVQDACDQAVSIKEHFAPSITAPTYNDHYGQFRQLYPRLKGFHSA